MTTRRGVGHEIAMKKTIKTMGRGIDTKQLQRK
jgi:hypothetical protein